MSTGFKKLTKEARRDLLSKEQRLSLLCDLVDELAERVPSASLFGQSIWEPLIKYCVNDLADQGMTAEDWQKLNKNPNDPAHLPKLLIDNHYGRGKVMDGERLLCWREVNRVLQEAISEAAQRHGIAPPNVPSGQQSSVPYVDPVAVESTRAGIEEWLEGPRSPASGRPHDDNLR